MALNNSYSLRLRDGEYFPAARKKSGIAIHPQNAEWWREQKTELLAVDSLRVFVAALQDSIAPLRHPASPSTNCGSRVVRQIPSHRAARQRSFRETPGGSPGGLRSGNMLVNVAQRDAGIRRISAVPKAEIADLLIGSSIRKKRPQLETQNRRSTTRSAGAEFEIGDSQFEATTRIHESSPRYSGHSFEVLNRLFTFQNHGLLFWAVIPFSQPRFAFPDHGSQRLLSVLNPISAQRFSGSRFEVSNDGFQNNLTVLLFLLNERKDKPVRWHPLWCHAVNSPLIAEAKHNHKQQGEDDGKVPKQRS